MLVPSMEHQLHERRALNALAFHVIDARDVEEMILVVVSQIAFHLGRVHTAVRLRHVDGRIADLREDIDGHAFDGQDGAQGDGDQGHDHGDRSASAPLKRGACSSDRPPLRKGWMSPRAACHSSSARHTFRRASASSISRLHQQPLRLRDIVDRRKARSDSAR